VWREDDPYPMNWQVVVDLETELGPAIFVQTLGILYPPADSLRSLTSFGGELQPDGTWAIHPVDLIVQVCRRRIWPFGDVREVVAASVVPATAADAAVTALAAQADEASVVAPAPRSGVNLGGLSSRLAVPANDVGPEIAHGATRRDVLIETTPTSPIQEPIPSRTPSPARESVPAAPIAPEPDENGDDEVRESGAPEDNLDPARTPPADAAPALAPASPAPPPVRVLTAALEPAVDDRADDAPVPDDGHEEDVDAELERYRRARWDEEG
jgi:hypothetical protein